MVTLLWWGAGDTAAFERRRTDFWRWHRFCLGKLFRGGDLVLSISAISNTNGEAGV